MSAEAARLWCRNVHLHRVCADAVRVEAALQYSVTGEEERVRAYANNAYNPGGGTHLSGFRAAVTRAIRRLAFLTDVVGEAKMAQFTAGKPELEYTPGMFQRMRPGVVTAPEPNGLPEPLPVSVL